MKSRKKLRNGEKKNLNQEKYFGIEKKFLESRKIFQNQDEYFRIEKTVSESRNILLEESRKNLWN